MTVVPQGRHASSHIKAWQVLVYNHRYDGTLWIPEYIVHCKKRLHEYLDLQRNQNCLLRKVSCTPGMKPLSLFSQNHTHTQVSFTASLCDLVEEEKCCSYCSKRGLLEGEGLRPVISLLLLQRAHCTPHFHKVTQRSIWGATVKSHSPSDPNKSSEEDRARIRHVVQ